MYVLVVRKIKTNSWAVRFYFDDAGHGQRSMILVTSEQQKDGNIEAPRTRY